MSVPSPLPRDFNKPIAPRFKTLVPSIFRNVIVSSVLLLLVFCAVMTWIFALLGNRSQMGVERESIPGWLFLASVLTLAVNYLACSRISSALFGFGMELRDFSMFGSKRLFPLALRMLALPLLFTFLVAPAIAVSIGVSGWITFQNPWLFGINLSLLHMVFCVGSAFIGINPTYNRVLRYATQALFPFRFLSGVLGIGSFWVLFLLVQIVRIIFKYLQETVVLWLNITAAWADNLLHITGIGPLILFWINPVYLLLKVHLGEGMGLGAQLAFGAVCLMATTGMLLRLRYWTDVDLDERCEDIYEQWLEIRQSIPLRDPRQAAGAADYWNSMDSPESPGLEGTADGIGSNVHTGSTSLTFELPSDATPEAFVEALSKKVEAYPNKIAIGAIAAIALCAFKWPPMLILAAGIWLVITVAELWSVRRAVRILPLRVWPKLTHMLRHRILPVLPVDAAFAVAMVIAFGLELHNIVPITLVLLGARLLTLSLLICYVVQSKGGVTIAILCGLVYLLLSFANVNITVDPADRWLSWTLTGIAWAAMALSWSATTVVLYRHNWMQHDGM